MKMRILTSILFSVLLAHISLAQDSATGQLTGLFQALNSSGLTAFVSAIESLGQSDSKVVTTLGNSFLQALNTSDVTLFVPTNEAFRNVSDSTTNDEDLFASVLSYHVVYGNFSSNGSSLIAANSPNHTIGRTLLNTTNLVQLEGNKNQVLVWNRNGSNIQILNQNSNNVTVYNSTTFGNVTINTISSVLTPPQNLTSVLAESDISSVQQILGSLQGFTPSAGLKGYTFFAPNNQAIQNVSSAIQVLQQNSTALLAVLQNHFINGTTVYSTDLSSDSKFVSGGGQQFSFIVNSTGTFVTSGSTTAKIVRSDVLTSSGVIHVIDNVLTNTESNPTAASSAVASASSAATASRTTETGPVGTGPAATAASGGSSGNGENNAASSIIPYANWGFIAGMAGLSFGLVMAQ